MSALLLVLLSAVLVCHYAPAVPGLRPFEQTEPFHNALGLALASLIAMTLLAPLGYVIEQWVLRPAQLQYLRILMFVMIAMALAQLIAFALQRNGRWQPLRGSFPLLMTAHCGVLANMLFAAARIDGLGAAVLSGGATGLAFGALLLTFTTLLQRLQHANVPKAFRDVPLALITAGLMALALMGLTGLVRD